ncbi:MAG TPA: hypothetical protein EYQ07_07060 [Candidatus Poseidoniales archaeon]|nr:MAG: hypothetical protein CXT64_05575 [Euryarchaeota archaeon]HIE82262.1 hypothetical protein [Candidatus Poseidoniales archaeon]HIL49507.1 hypothetical protein [Candidatus Poseidoniales archaeon]
MSRTSQIPLILMSFVMLAAPMSGCIAVFKPGAGADGSENWIDPVIEIEDENHTHIDLLAHRLATANARLIDYHNLNCDGNEKPPAEFDDTMGRPCLEESKNTPPTPGDNSEISIEGNFLEDCEIYPDGSGGCYAYVAGYQQFEILDISNPNNIQLLSTYYAEVARIIDIKVSPDNNWVLINHELTNSELDPIPNDDDANSGMNRLDVIYVGEKTSPVKVAEWNNPPAGFHNQDMHVYCGWDGALDPREECSLFLFGADPYPELVEGGSGSRYKGTQIFYVPLGFESWLPNQNNEQQNSSREIIRWGGYSPESQTTCGGSVFNHDNVYFTHPITKQKLLAVSYWGAGLRFVDVSNPPTLPDPFGISWPPEIGRWLGCPTADDGWYGPDGGGHANMSAEEWLDSAQGNDNIHYAVPMDNLICSGVSELDPIEDWPEQCGSGPEDPTHGINWRHFTYISPEYGSNDNHTGYIWTIDTTDPTKPFLVSKWRLPGEGMKANGTSHPQHWIPGGYIFSPHNGDTGPTGHAYWAHYHAGAWATDHGKIWDELVWENGFAEPERGFQAIVQLAETHTIGYYLPAGPTWIEDPAATLGWDMADCWASCMIPFDWGLQYDPRGFVFISEMVSGVYVVQFDEDWDSRFDYPPLWSAQATDEE